MHPAARGHMYQSQIPGAGTQDCERICNSFPPGIYPEQHASQCLVLPLQTSLLSFLCDGLISTRHGLNYTLLTLTGDLPTSIETVTHHLSIQRCI